MKKFYQSFLPMLLLIQAFQPSFASIMDIRGILGMEEVYEEGVGGWSPTWGAVNTETQPWLHSEALGWVYFYDKSSPEGYWFWLEKLRWIYSTRELFPEAYLGNKRIFLDLTEKKRIKFWIFETKEWVIARKGISDSTPVFDAVPEELRGLNYSGFATTIRIGPYYLYQESRTGSGPVQDYYYYDKTDGYFYPLEVSLASSRIWLSGWNKIKITKEENIFTITRNDILFGTEPVVESYPIVSE